MAVDARAAVTHLRAADPVLAGMLDDVGGEVPTWTPSGDPRAPNVLFVGFVAQVPAASTGGYMTIQTAI